MTLKTEGRRFVQELRRTRRARLLAHQTIASMDGGWWGGILQNRMRPVVLTAAARRGCLSTRVLPRDAARLYRQVARCHAEKGTDTIRVEIHAKGRAS